MSTSDQPDRAGEVIELGRRLHNPNRWSNTFALLYQLMGYRATAARACELREAMTALMRQRTEATHRLTNLPHDYVHAQQEAQAQIDRAERALDALAEDAARLARGG